MKKKGNLIIIGSGDLAREVIDLNSDIDDFNSKGFNILGLVDEKKNPDLEFPFYKNILDIPDFKEQNYCIAINDNSKRHLTANKLEKYNLNKLPIYIQDNKDKFKEWID